MLTMSSNAKNVILLKYLFLVSLRFVTIFKLHIHWRACEDLLWYCWICLQLFFEESMFCYTIIVLHTFWHEYVVLLLSCFKLHIILLNNTTSKNKQVTRSQWINSKYPNFKNANHWYSLNVCTLITSCVSHLFHWYYIYILMVRWMLL